MTSYLIGLLKKGKGYLMKFNDGEPIFRVWVKVYI